MENGKLKGCPFCGGYVIIEREHKPFNATFTGKCTECGMMFMYQEEQEPLRQRIGGGIIREYEDHMIFIKPTFERAWNRRPDKNEPERYY